MAGDDDNETPDASADVTYDVWVCQGRLCRSHGADDVSHACAHELDGDARARLLRGGCYGLCDLGANVVIRRYDNAGAPRTDTDVDRLTLKGGDDEFVSCGVTANDVKELLQSFLDDGLPLVRLSRAVKEAEQPPRSTIEARMRALREKRRSQP